MNSAQNGMYGWKSNQCLCHTFINTWFASRASSTFLRSQHTREMLTLGQHTGVMDQGLYRLGGSGPEVGERGGGGVLNGSTNLIPAHEGWGAVGAVCLSMKMMMTLSSVQLPQWTICSHSQKGPLLLLEVDLVDLTKARDLSDRNWSSALPNHIKLKPQQIFPTSEWQNQAFLSREIIYY